MTSSKYDVEYRKVTTIIYGDHVLVIDLCVGKTVEFTVRDLKKNYVKTITQIGTFILNHQESKYRIYGSVLESITKY